MNINSSSPHFTLPRLIRYIPRADYFSRIFIPISSSRRRNLSYVKLCVSVVNCCSHPHCLSRRVREHWILFCDKKVERQYAQDDDEEQGYCQQDSFSIHQRSDCRGNLCSPQNQFKALLTPFFLFQLKVRPSANGYRIVPCTFDANELVALLFFCSCYLLCIDNLFIGVLRASGL